MSYQSIMRDLARHKVVFDLDFGSVGKDLMDIDVTQMIVMHLGQQAPDGTRWQELGYRYAAWKSKVSPGNPIGYLYGVMLDPRQLEGVRQITARWATMTYGITPEARQEAEWFTEGDPNQNRPPRPFYDQTAESIRRKDAYLAKHLRDKLLRS